MAKNFIFFILAVFPAAFATEAVHEFYNLDKLKNLTDGGIEKVLEISSALDETPNSYRDIIAERYECIQWECTVEKQNVNKSTANTVIKGLLGQKKLVSFQCISNSSRVTLDKLDAKCSTLPQDSETVLQNALGAVMPYKLLIPGFNKYVQDLYQTKKEELSKASNEDAKKKIILEVENKMKFLASLLDQIRARIEMLENSFFEIYVDFVYATETAVRKIQREGTQKMLKCIN